MKEIRWMNLNQSVEKGPWMKAIERYSWVMFNAINYAQMSLQGKAFFDKHVLIVSWMYGLIRSTDSIANYKLPIDTTWLRQRWWQQLTKAIVKSSSWVIVDLLPNAHKKCIDFTVFESVVRVDFFFDGKKMSHGVKGVKWQRLQDRCEQQETDYKKWPKTIEYKEKTIDVLYT